MYIFIPKYHKLCFEDLMLNGLPETMQLSFLVQSWHQLLKFRYKLIVLLANRFVKKDVANGKSFIYMRNSRGPRTLPWGTPHATVFSLEKIPFMQTY